MNKVYRALFSRVSLPMLLALVLTALNGVALHATPAAGSDAVEWLIQDPWSGIARGDDYVNDSGSTKWQITGVWTATDGTTFDVALKQNASNTTDISPVIQAGSHVRFYANTELNITAPESVGLINKVVINATTASYANVGLTVSSGTVTVNGTQIIWENPDGVSTFTAVAPKQIRFNSVTIKNSTEDSGKSIYLRGSMNGWDNIDGWEMTTTDGVNYSISGITFAKGDEFKIADAEWGEINYGEGYEVESGASYTLIYDGGNCIMAQSLEDATVTFNLETMEMRVDGTVVADRIRLEGSTLDPGQTIYSLPEHIWLDFTQDIASVSEEFQATVISSDGQTYPATIVIGRDWDMTMAWLFIGSEEDKIELPLGSYTINIPAGMIIGTNGTSNEEINLSFTLDKPGQMDLYLHNYGHSNDYEAQFITEDYVHYTLSGIKLDRDNSFEIIDHITWARFGASTDVANGGVYKLEQNSSSWVHESLEDVTITVNTETLEMTINGTVVADPMVFQGTKPGDGAVVITTPAYIWLDFTQDVVAVSSEILPIVTDESGKTYAAVILKGKDPDPTAAWLVFGTENIKLSLPVGTYHVNIPAGAIIGASGRSNEEINFSFTIEETTAMDFYLQGSMNESAMTELWKFTTTDNLVYTFTGVNFTKGDVLKIVDETGRSFGPALGALNGQWYDANADCDCWIDQNIENATITYDRGNNRMRIDGLVEVELYLIGSVNPDGSHTDEWKFTTSDKKVYTISGLNLKRGEYLYFVDVATWQHYGAGCDVENGVTYKVDAKDTPTFLMQNIEDATITFNMETMEMRIDGTVVEDPIYQGSNPDNGATLYSSPDYIWLDFTHDIVSVNGELTATVTDATGLTYPSVILMGKDWDSTAAWLVIGEEDNPTNLPLGTYTINIPAGVITVSDGRSNEEINLSFSIEKLANMDLWLHNHGTSNDYEVQFVTEDYVHYTLSGIKLDNGNNFELIDHNTWVRFGADTNVSNGGTYVLVQDKDSWIHNESLEDVTITFNAETLEMTINGTLVADPIIFQGTEPGDGSVFLKTPEYIWVDFTQNIASVSGNPIVTDESGATYPAELLLGRDGDPTAAWLVFGSEAEPINLPVGVYTVNIPAGVIIAENGQTNKDVSFSFTIEEATPANYYLNVSTSEEQLQFSTTDNVIYTLSGINLMAGDVFKLYDESGMSYGTCGGISVNGWYDMYEGCETMVERDIENATITYNRENRKIRIEGLSALDMYIAGSVNFDDPFNDQWKLTTTDKVTYTISGVNFKKYDYFYFVDRATSNTYGTGCNVENGVTYKVTPEAQIHLMQNIENATITFNMETMEMRIDGTVVLPTIYLRGSMNNWDEIQGWEMTTADGVMYTISGVTLTKGCEFKIADADWDVINYGEYVTVNNGEWYTLTHGGGNCVMGATIENATVSFNIQTFEMSVWGTVVEAASTYYLIGNVNGWSPNDMWAFKTPDGINFYLEDVTIHAGEGFVIRDISTDTYIYNNAYEALELDTEYQYGMMVGGYNSDFYLTQTLDNSAIHFSLTGGSIMFGDMASSVPALVARPKFAPANSDFYEKVEVSLTAQDGCTIYYTLDGNSPTAAEAKVYTAPFVLTENTMVQAAAMDAGGMWSKIATKQYYNTRHGIGEDFNPSSPPDPEMSSKKYDIIVVSNPTGAGHLYYPSEASAGETVNVSVSNSTNFVFENWTINGEVVSTSTSYSFTMPENDVNIVANFKYSPSNPADPSKPVFQHPVTTQCEPAGAGWFNFGSSSVAEGDSIDVYAYNSTNFRFKGWKVDGVEIEQTTSPLWVKMDRKPVSVVGMYEYYPSSPANPGANYWNGSTGQAIIDDFETGDLYSAITNLIGWDNLANITSLVVKGKVNNNDFGSMANSNYTGLGSLDITRIDGVTSVPSYAFQYSYVGSIYLPACITSIGNYAFYGCQNLNSLSVYATVPPTVSRYTFSEFTNKANCVVRVPSESIALYEQAEYWKDFTIMPLAEDLHALQVSLPEDCVDGRYKNNRIELVNIATGARQKYVVTERLNYSFIGLQKDEQYNVYLLSQTGLEIGRIENILISDSDVEVAFTDLKNLKMVSAVVKTPEGVDVTAQASVEWYEPQSDGTMAYLRKTAQLGEVPVGQKLVCDVTLPERLGIIYADPEQAEFTVTDATPILTVELQALRSIALSGSVVDENGMALKGASVSVNASLNGSFPTTVNARTDKDGKWKTSVLDASEYRLTYSASERINVLDTIAAFAPEVSEMELEPVVLREIASTRVSYGFTYTPAAKQGETAAVEQFYNDYKNVTVDVYNITQSRAHNQLSLQYPIVVILDENINAGDKLRLTAKSTTGAFADIVEEAVVDENQRAEATFNIVGKGGVEAKFSMTENPAVIAMLYNSNGNLVKTVDYSEAFAEFSSLEAGNYTLVSIGKSTLLTGIQRLATLTEVGLADGTDYVMNVVSVKNGEIVEVNNELVPSFDENRFKYTSSNALFSLNKTSLTPGSYLTLKSTVDFKAAYKAGISDIKMIYDLPENCEMVANSVMKGRDIVGYELDGNRVIVSLGNIGYNEQVRFVVIPTMGGEASFSCYVSFEHEGKTITQPLGNAICQVKDMEISVPSVTAKTTIPVSGMVRGRADIEVYDGTELIGKTKSLADGSWNTKCELSNPYNLSSHDIYAKVVNSDGVILQSETRECLYDSQAVEVSKVVMHYRGTETVFDFENPTSESKSYSYSSSEFTFTIDFTNNSPKVVSNVILWVKTTNGSHKSLIARYDAVKDLWIATGKFDNPYPVNVSVDFVANTDVKMDADVYNDSFTAIEIGRTEILEDVEEHREVEAAIDAALSDENCTVEMLVELLDKSNLLSGVNSDADSDVDLSAMTEEELIEYCNNLKTKVDDVIASDSSEISAEDLFAQSFVDAVNEIEGVTMADAANFTEESLINLGFTKIDRTDGTAVFILATDTNYQVVDLANDSYITIDTTLESELQAQALRANSSADFMAIMYKYREKIEGHFDKLRDYATRIAGLVEDVLSTLIERSSKLGDQIVEIDDSMKAIRSLPNANSPYWQDELKDLAKRRQKLANKVIKNESLISWFEKNLPVEKLKIGKIGGGVFAVFDMFMIVRGALEDIDQVIALYKSIPDPCEDDQANADSLRGRIRNTGIAAGLFYSAQFISDIAQIAGLFISIPAIVPTGGTSLSVVAACVGLAVANFATSIAYEKIFESRMNDHYLDARLLQCLKNCGEPGKPSCPTNPGGGNGSGGSGSGSADLTPIIDPAGYVYEAVPSNRLEGVQASCYYKEVVEDMYGDLIENVVLWNAEEYAQKNPLFTDENGMYRWDVPQGLWQVKFEKDGYVTTQSEWLPVPPPQLEVNIPMVQNRQPEILEAHAYERGVQVTFDEYMDPETLTPQTMFITVNGETFAGEVVMMDAEVSDPFAIDEASAKKFATTFRFVPAENLSMSMGVIRLTISREVKSYAGIPMAANYSQVLDLEKEITDIVADGPVQVLYGGERVLTVDVVPFDASVGKTLRVANSSPSILSIDSEEFVIDENGQAKVTLTGELPGQAALTFTVDDSWAMSETAINVVTELYEVNSPVASRASGTEVYRGTKISLSTETPNATIYYTIDGSCPCDEDSRLKYVLPIEINADANIKAMVLTSNNEESETVEFNYTLKTSALDYTMAEGWTWISHNLDQEVAPAEIGSLEAVDRIVGQNSEVVRDPVYGLVGNLKNLSAEESYKVQATVNSERLRLSDYARNPALPISVARGWNWLGYPSGQTMSVAEAFANTAVENGDYIVGQMGFSQYNGSEWEGTLATLVPGSGYLFFSTGDKNIVYNTEIVSKAASIHAMVNTEASPWSVDIHKYPQVMCMVITLEDNDGYEVAADSYQLGAFCGTECRGIGKVVNGKIMMSVYGQASDEITFRAVGIDDSMEIELADKFSFSETMIGDVNNPYVIVVENEMLSNPSIMGEMPWKVSVENRTLHVSGGYYENISNLSLIGMNGSKVLSTSTVSEDGVSLEALPEGVYGVVIEDDGNYSYFKIVIK